MTFFERCLATTLKPMVLKRRSRACGSGWQYSTNSKPSVPIGFSSEISAGGASCGNGPMVFLLSCLQCGRPLHMKQTHSPCGGCSSSSGSVRLVGRRGVLESLELGAGCLHRDDLRIGIERNIEAPGVEDLRHEINIRQRDLGPE